MKTSKTFGRMIALILMLCLLPLSGFAQSGGSADLDSESFTRALNMLNNSSKTDVDKLEDIKTLLKQAGTYQKGVEYLTFVESLLLLQGVDEDRFDRAYDSIQRLSKNKDFTLDYYSQFDKSNKQALPELEKLLQYINARKLEAGGDRESAIAMYDAYPVLDAVTRAGELTSAIRKEKFDKAIAYLSEGSLASVQEAEGLFRELGSYRDSQQRLKDCQTKLVELTTPVPTLVPTPTLIPTPSPKPSPTPTLTLPPLPTNTNGSGNHVNGNLALLCEGQIVYQNNYDKGNIYIGSKSGGDDTFLCKASSPHMSSPESIGTFHEGWLYYFYDQNLCKIALDSRKTEILLRDVYHYLSGGYFIINERIYFLQVPTSNTSDNLYCADLDGRNLTIIDGVKAVQFVGDSQFIYYIETDTFNIIRYDLANQTNRIIWKPGYSYSLSLVGEYIYFSNGNQILKLKKDGSGLTEVSNAVGFYFNVIGDWLYYSNTNDNGRIYRITIDGRLKEKICDVTNGWNISIAGEWIYFMQFKDSVGWVDTYKMKLDGSELQLAIAPTPKPSSTPTIKPTLIPELPKVGDTVSFGHYEQDNNLSNGKESIAWRVLMKEEGKALLISEMGLDCRPYHTVYDSVTWEICSLRKWLNADFLEATFTAAEQKAIVSTMIRNEDNPEYNTEGGRETCDKIFLLSITEAQQYFSDDVYRVLQLTTFAMEQGKGTWSNERFVTWWLRSPGDSSSMAAHTLLDGSVFTSGGPVLFPYLAVRPVLWVDLSSGII